MSNPFEESPPVVNSPEVSLLLCCALTERGAEKAEKIKHFVATGIDWECLIRIARKHRVLSLLYWSLHKTCPQAAPKVSMEQLRSYFYTTYSNNFFLANELIKLLRLLHEKSIHAVPFKGPVLSTFAYGNLCFRQFGDLDILVHQREVLKTKDLLMSNGYEPKFQLTAAQESALLRTNHAYNLVRKDGQVIVEIHWKFIPEYFAPSLNLAYLWEKLEMISLAGGKVPNLPPEENLLILCAHGSKHCWNRLDYVCDVAELIRTSQEINWLELISKANTLETKRMLLLGVSLAHVLLGAVIPGRVLETIRADSAVKSLVKRVCESLFHEPCAPYGELTRVPFHLKLRESMFAKTRYIFRFLLTPTFEDWNFLRLPSRLSMLYTIFRPMRLFLIQPVLRYLPRPNFQFKND